MNRIAFNFFIIITSIFFYSCGSENVRTEKFYRDLGKIESFCEMVASDVKYIAISPVMTTTIMDDFMVEAQKVADGYGVELYRENDLFVTDLFPADIATGKEVVLMGKSGAIEDYKMLKAEIKELEREGFYEEEVRRKISRRFGRMLSYSTSRINDLLAENTDFRAMDHFGVKGGHVFLYYDDLAAATAFYRDVLGLEVLATYDIASIIRIAGNSIIILVDASKGMHSTEEPKTVALALLTNQLAQWYDHLKAQNVSIKYEYKASEGSAHDGFVAIDPEGYLLEFETFNQHPENERFVPILAGNRDYPTSIEGLSFNGTIVWLYYKDLLSMQGFMEEVFGFSMVADQGWAKIYRATDYHYIGLVDEKRGMHQFTEEKAVSVAYILDDVDGWYEYVTQNNLFPIREGGIHDGPDKKFRAFVGFDPEGYFLEFDQFFEHPDNEQLMRVLSE